MKRIPPRSALFWGPYGQANATSRAIACELERMGIQVEFRYPDDETAPLDYVR